METWQFWVSLVGGIVTIVSAFVGALWVVFSKFADLKTCFGKIEALERSMSDASERMAHLDATLRDHDSRLTSIETVLIVKHKGIDTVFSAKHSPRVLNSLGLRMYEDMKGRDFLEKNKEALFEQIDLRRPKAALDVETYASVALYVCVDEDFFIPMKNYVYNCPEIDTEGGSRIDMTMDVVCYILSLPLRDMYLEAHPEIPCSND